MATSLPATQGDAAPLTKPVDWSIFMVTAALCLTKDTNLLKRFASSDEAKMALNDSLNWHEAHDSYKWPAFTTMNFDFAQSMRLRRALIHDMFVALQKAGCLDVGTSAGIGNMGTPDSARKSGGNRATARGNGRSAKRQCPHSPHDTDTDDSDNDNGPFWQNNNFLAEAMSLLISRSDADIVGYLNGQKDSLALANIVHDGLVRAWKGPEASYGNIPEELQRKKEAWRQSTPTSNVEVTTPKTGLGK